MQRTRAWMWAAFAAAAVLGLVAVGYARWRSEPRPVSASQAAETLMTGVPSPDPPVVWVFVFGGAAVVALLFGMVLAANRISQGDTVSDTKQPGSG